MSVVTRSNTPSLFEPGVRDFYGSGAAMEPEVVRKFFDSIPSNRSFEEYVELATFGLHPEKKESAPAESDIIQETLRVEILQVAYSKAFVVSHETMADNLYGKAFNAAEQLGRSASRTYETVLAQFLQNGFTTSIHADGLSIFNVDNPTFGGGTYANRPSVGSTISESSLQSDNIIIRNMLNARGQVTNIRGMKLLVSPDAEFQTAKVLKSILEPATGNNAINSFSRESGMIPEGYDVTSYLSGDAYFISCDQKGLLFQDRESPRLMKDTKVRTLDMEYVSYFRFGHGMTDKRSAYGNPGA